MAEKDGKTEKPTSIRRQRAQEEGSIAYSQQVASTMSLIAAFAAAGWVFSFRGGFGELLGRLLNVASAGGDAELLLLRAVNDTGIYFLLVIAPILGAAWAGALAGNIIQGLPKYASKALTPKWDKLNPANGLKKLKTKVSPVEWARVLVLLAVLAVAIWQAVGGNWEALLRTPMVPVESSNTLLWSILLRVLTYVLITLALMAVVDFFIQRHRHEESLKMTKSEVKQDNRQTDGNPEVKGKVRTIQRQQAKKRMIAAVQDADVIITNPTHVAVALEYKPETMAAPRVVAKGLDWMALKIKDVGREYDIPRVENVLLARALYRSVEVDQEIPLDLYKAVAEVLAFVFRTRKRRNRRG